MKEIVINKTEIKWNNHKKAFQCYLYSEEAKKLACLNKHLDYYSDKPILFAYFTFNTNSEFNARIEDIRDSIDRYNNIVRNKEKLEKYAMEKLGAK
jgi:hypothetical protein